jgi:hypothetical protein
MPAACYVVIDGTPWNGKHKPAGYYMGWYGDQYGAEQRMKSSSIARAPQHIPGEEPPESRAYDMAAVGPTEPRSRNLESQARLTGASRATTNGQRGRGRLGRDRLPK